ncbi:MAG: SGNH/GDSL hydrolase family protein [Nanoarchaeota archaeon]|nr:SGNH/GDSL hydrolase family protein [Nanoarchaeota archaeon]
MKTRKISGTVKRSLQINLALFVLSILLCFIGLEIVTRIPKTDPDGQAYFFGKQLRPYKLPVNSLMRAIDSYNESSYIMYDNLLGWKVRPLSESSNGKYKANSLGLRGPEPLGNKKVIAIFGDSFIHGDDVYYHESLAYYLQEMMPEYEVMNYGVPGYGFDQAYLRYLEIASKTNPDIVIVGFQPENCLRNMNIIRSFYQRGTMIPFTKPRFFDGKLVNYPTVEISKITETVASFSGSELSRYEYFYNQEDYQEKWYLNSRAIAVLDAYIHPKRTPIFGGETEKLCLDIARKFDNSVFLHIPAKEYLMQKKLGSYPYETMLSTLSREHIVIDPTEALLDEDFSSLYVGHFSGKGNKILAESVVKYLSNRTKV